MKKRWVSNLLVWILATSLPLLATAKNTKHHSKAKVEIEQNELDELNPFDPNIDEILNKMDQNYEQETGKSAHIDSDSSFSELFRMKVPKIPEITCIRNECAIWAQVVKSTQTLYLFVRGELQATWHVSTGVPGRGTPNIDRHPDGRIYDRYTSAKFPGGDYRGLGNMPYAVFIYGGFAIHGTGESNWKKLGQRASHGCIRIHPDNAYQFNRMVRQAGVKNVWITVQD